MMYEYIFLIISTLFCREVATDCEADTSGDANTNGGVSTKVSQSMGI